MRCSKCGFENPEGMKFCGQCTNPLALICPKCRFENPPGFKFCGQCTAPLSASETKATPSIQKGEAAADTRAVEAERKTVTALFADIKGSTEMLRDLDPEDARAIVDPVLQLMMEAVHRYGGYVAQLTGDGIFALFGAPIAHEDHPQRALHAALAMQEELRRYAERHRNVGKIPVEARVGVNTGEVVVRTIETGGHTEYTPVGHVTNLAARMQTAAPSGSIAVSETTQRLCEGYFEFRALGSTTIKGFDAPVEVYEVLRAGPLRTHFELAARRGLTRFVGREHEVGELKRTFELARNGRGQIVAIVAEAGTGKSRLVHEFKAILPPECKMLEAQSASYGKASAWLPVLALLCHYFDIQDADDTAARRGKIRVRLSNLDAGLNDTLPYLFGLLGIVDGADPLPQMDPQIKRQRTLEAIKRIILRESLTAPSTVIFEDLHWIDVETQALLDLLADSIANRRVLLLVNYRPEYRHEWTNKSYYTQLRLDPLGGTDRAAMLSALLGDGEELDPIKQQIVARTGGNPFFIEEIIQALFDEGTLVCNGALKMTRPLSELRLPPTVHGILASRIDRLSTGQKDLLQTLAVIGRQAPLELIKKMACTHPSFLEQMLAELRRAEFIVERPADVDVEYVFRHALTQEVAYQSLLIERRKQLHGDAGAAIEKVYSNSINDHLSELAYHYSRSSNQLKALYYNERAGRLAQERSAYAEAVSHFTAALELIRSMPESSQRSERELTLLLALGPVINVTKGWSSPAVEAVYERAHDLCQQLEETPQLFAALFGLAAHYYVRGEYKPARENTKKSLSLARRSGDSNMILQAYHLLGNLQTYTGDLVTACQSLDEVITRYRSETHHPLINLYGGDDPAVCCLSHKAWAVWLLGYPDQSVQIAERAVSLAQKLDHPGSLALAFAFMAMLFGFRRERARALDAARCAVLVCKERGLSFFDEIAEFAQTAFTPERTTAQGVKKIRKIVESSEPWNRAVRLAMLAEAAFDGSHYHQASAALCEALAVVDSKGERMWEAELFRLRGELGKADQEDAKSDFRRAIATAQSQQARSLELRATTSLARLLAKQSRRDEARAMLAKIYGWFTEGFDTADLKDAKALLDELGV